MGERFRLKASFVIPSNWSPEAKAIAQAMKDYGLIVADNGSDMFFQGTPSTSGTWTRSSDVQAIPATEFEVVDLTPVRDRVERRLRPTAGGTSVTITGHNFSGAAGQLQSCSAPPRPSSVTILSDTRSLPSRRLTAAGTVDIRVQSGSMRTNTDNQRCSSATDIRQHERRRLHLQPNAPPPPPPRLLHRHRRPLLPPSAQPFAIGSNPGQVATVTMYNPDRTVQFTAQPFGAIYKGGVRVAVGDVTGDGVPDIVAVTNWRHRGSGPHHRRRHACRTVDQLLGTTSYTGKVSVAVGM